MGWVNPRWNSISDPDLRAIFQSLQDFLADPTFDKGIKVGNGTPPTYNSATDLTTYQNLLRWGSDQLNAAMADTPDGSAPSGSPTPTVQGAIGAMVVTWARVANNNSVVYEVHLGTSSTFTASSTTKVGEVTDGSSFWIRNEPGGATLQWGVTYYVRLIARDSDGAAAASSAVSGVPLQVNADFLATHAIVAGNAVIDAAAISSAMIASLDAGKITTGTLDANRIAANSINASKLAALNLEVGKFIKSNSYTAGTAGWAINADGTAEFNNVIVRGTVYATNGSFSGTLSTNAISGWLTTQTGGGFRSGASGAHVEIQGGSWSNEVGFFTGDASETAHGYISAFFSNPNGNLQIAPPQISGQGQMCIYTLRNVIGGNARHNFTGDVYINGSLTMQVAPSWQGASLVNGWVNYGAPSQNARFWKDPMGFVTIEGNIKNGTWNLNVTLFTLPAGYRPPALVSFITFAQGAGGAAWARIDVDTAGNVILANAGGAATANQLLTLTGIRFSTMS